MLARELLEVIKLWNMYSWSWDFIKHIEDYSMKHKENFNETYNGFWVITETSIEILNLTLEILKHSNRKNWKWYYWTQYLLILNTIPFLFWTYKNTIDWFYIQSSINLRWAFESLLRLYFINFNPTNFNKIFWDGAEKQLKTNWKILKDYQTFKVTKFIKDDLKIQEWLKIYKILSYESHSNMISVISDMARVEKWDSDIIVDMKGKIDIGDIINLLFMILYAFLKYVDEILIKDTIFDNQGIEGQKNEIFKTKDYLIKILENELLKDYKDQVDQIMKRIIVGNFEDKV